MYKLMTVDDSSVIRNRIERCSQSSSEFVVVAKASSGIEAVAMYQEFRPQLVTMDLIMPNMDGLACIRQLKNIEPKVKILVVSAISDKATGIRALKYGARGFLGKPFADEDFLRAVDKLIAARS